MVRPAQGVSGAGGQTGDLVGTTLAGRFSIRRVIGRGAMGTVYAAQQMPLDRPVAVKVLELSTDTERPETVRERFLREASVLGKLEHPNIVRVYDFGVEADVPFLVMELVDGFSLRRLLGSGPMPAIRAVDIVLQIVAALREAHALGMVHRDLKPANILLTRQGGQLDFVKVVDFGLAKSVQGNDSELTMQGQVMGTPMYMAPEQIRDEATDGRADLYAVGVILYRALTGQAPFEKGTSAHDVLLGHLYETPRRFADVHADLRVPPALEWVVMRCLEKRPQDRFGSAAELQKALKACRRALEDPAQHDLTVGLVAGQTVVGEGQADASQSSLSVRRPAGRTGGHTAPEIAPPPTPVPVASTWVEPPPTEVRLSVPRSLAGVVFGLLLVLGVVAGIVFDRVVRAPASNPKVILAEPAPSP